MKTNRISGFQWALTIFVFFVVTMALSIILRDFQATIGIKRFVFDIRNLAPAIAAVICILAFKNKPVQLAGLKLSVNIRVVERMLLALILPLIIFIIGMFSFNAFADSFILLQASDLSVSVFTILIGHIVMAFFAEFGFRSYIQNITETKVNTFFASIIVGLMYSVWTANTTYGTEYAAYHFLYTFMFSMIVGELIRATRGRTIYIAVIFHAAMTFAQVFLFSEELGDVFSMKVIALSTTIVAIVFYLLSLIVHFIFYRNTNQSLDEVEPNNYLDHMNDDDNFASEKEGSVTRHEKDNHLSDTDSTSSVKENLKESASYENDRHSSVVDSAKDKIDSTKNK
ncbi:CPBP family intramembrane metalloprotease [Staphylococcus croceilyticus]|uniref:CPBP family intramembrane metalloprotease n=1 Tax=Staphylococcus croceilyticus TaxID=319942 RepID=A0ABY2KA92_9STAP|nr:CPBP family intramembrane glutamic endopeptidase [Staphylococcus croceilyticus]PNZ68403.1 CPBP family intramembrane metalloprotease domain-containing protein [Staphylococcus croceilyticus]TGA72804.1 CPBP family intramembrane metalloprotease [Staphylococcus croceilyticus]